MKKEVTNIFDLVNSNYFNLIEELVRYIKRSGIKVGDNLPSEAILADEIHSNRSTLREVLRVLEAFGFIESKRGSGNVFIRDPEIGFMNLFVISNIISGNEAMNISSLRANIESAAIEEFIKNAVDYDIFLLEMIFREMMEQIPDKKSHEYLEKHIAFHDQILKYYPNDTAKYLVHSGIRLVDNSPMTVDMPDPFIGKVRLVSHGNIIAAVKERNIPKAKELITGHIMIPGEFVTNY